MTEIDRNSDTPLARQIATILQYRMATGALRPGTALPSYRTAALEWGVHLHTVRRAYLDLAGEGLVRIDDRRGAIVLEYAGPPASDALDEFAGEVLAAADRRFGASPGDLIAALRRQSGARLEPPPVWCLECSWSLSRSLAEQTGAAWAIRARPWLVTRAASVPAGTLVTTYFHFEEFRRTLPTRAKDLEVVHIRPGLEFLDALRSEIGRARRVVLLDSEITFAHGVVPELRQALGTKVEIVASDPRSAAALLRSRRPRDLVVVSPRDWDRLPPKQRARPHVHRFAYDLDEMDLARIAARRGWRRADASRIRELPKPTKSAAARRAR